MSEPILVPVILLGLALIEGFNGINFAFRAKRTLHSARLSYDDGPGLLIQEFGVYSLAIAAAYTIAAFDPTRRVGIILVGIVINLAAGMMHLLRSAGIYLGDARPMLSRGSERNQGCIHALAVFALIAILPGKVLSF